MLLKDPRSSTSSRCSLPPVLVWRCCSFPDLDGPLAACGFGARAPCDSSEPQSLWEEWRASPPPWVTAPGFSSTKGALLPEATVGCNMHCREANANVQGQIQHSPGLKGCLPSHAGPKGSHGLSRDHLVQPQSDPRQVPRVPTPSQSSSLLCCPTVSNTPRVHDAEHTLH